MGFPSATLLTQGQSITGSFNRIQAMPSGSIVTAGGSAFAVAQITALKDGNGNTIPSFFLSPGQSVDLFITSASLGATSAPVMVFNI